jgi:hypothetical protein
MSTVISTVINRSEIPIATVIAASSEVPISTVIAPLSETSQPALVTAPPRGTPTG